MASLFPRLRSPVARSRTLRAPTSFSLSSQKGGSDMALIDVKRDDQPIAAEPVEKPDEMTLSAFRELLGARMRSSDEFLSKAGSPIDRVLQEDEVKVSDILEKDVVKIRGKSEPAGPVDVRVMKSGKSTPVKAEIEKSLSEFRKQVSSLIAENERFQEKDVAGSSFTLESEKAYKVK